VYIYIYIFLKVFGIEIWFVKKDASNACSYESIETRKN